ncbi:MAG: thioredoxin family protein [Candidatus Obscuribacterales bacterium]|nr:thioredoxin family protein [Candidatus Obscuribacterales bacterium]
MVLTQSTMLALGTSAPDFNLRDTVSGKQFSLKDFAAKKVLLVMFICKHCPYVVHVQNELAKLDSDYKNKDLSIVAISSNDAETHPQDAPASLKEFAQAMKFSFPLLYDETQEVAKIYTAACTPDFFVFDGERKLVYRGQLDSSRPGNSNPVSGEDLRKALDAALDGKPVCDDQKPSAGCNIKWKAGNAPSYFA